MRIGVGIPNSVAGATGKPIREWARRAEELGFSTLGTIGRVAYPTYDSLVCTWPRWRWDSALELMQRAWKGEPIPPSPKPITPRPYNDERVPMMFGGNSDRAIALVVKWGIG